jgi:DNA-binding LytR/AlgR family response regulator
VYWFGYPNLTSQTVTRPPRLLVVDDEPLVRKSLRRSLAALLRDQPGATVEDFGSPTEALLHFRPGVFDGALIDVCMPAMTGPELARRLRACDASLVIAFVTGTPEFVPSSADGLAGCMVLHKPWSIGDLARFIAALRT